MFVRQAIRHWIGTKLRCLAARVDPPSAGPLPEGITQLYVDGIPITSATTNADRIIRVYTG